MRPLNVVCLIRSICLSVHLCRELVPQGTAASMLPQPGTVPWEAASFSPPPAGGSRTKPRGVGMSGCQFDGCMYRCLISLALSSLFIPKCKYLLQHLPSTSRVLIEGARKVKDA